MWLAIKYIKRWHQQFGKQTLVRGQLRLPITEVVVARCRQEMCPLQPKNHSANLSKSCFFSCLSIWFLSWPLKFNWLWWPAGSQRTWDITQLFLSWRLQGEFLTCSLWTFSQIQIKSEIPDVPSMWATLLTTRGKRWCDPMIEHLSESQWYCVPLVYYIYQLASFFS